MASDAEVSFVFNEETTMSVHDVSALSYGLACCFAELVAAADRFNLGEEDGAVRFAAAVDETVEAVQAVGRLLDRWVDAWPVGTLPDRRDAHKYRSPWIALSTLRWDAADYVSSIVAAGLAVAGAAQADDSELRDLVTSAVKWHREIVWAVDVLDKCTA